MCSIIVTIRTAARANDGPCRVMPVSACVCLCLRMRCGTLQHDLFALARTHASCHHIYVRMLPISSSHTRNSCTGWLLSSLATLFKRVSVSGAHEMADSSSAYRHVAEWPRTVGQDRRSRYSICLCIYVDVDDDVDALNLQQYSTD